MTYKQIKEIITSPKIIKKVSYYTCLYYFPVSTLIIKTIYNFII